MSDLIKDLREAPPSSVEGWALRQKAADALEQSQWRPIESAPKDGTVLVWLSEPHKSMNSNVGVALFHPNVRFINGLFAHDLPEPTHWMPLPTPPTE